MAKSPVFEHKLRLKRPGPPAVQLLSGLRAVQTVTAGAGFTAVTSGSASLNWKGTGAIILLSVGQFAAAVGGVVDYRVLSGGVAVAGGATKWHFFHNTANEHHATTFLDYTTALSPGTQTISLEWQATTANIQSDGNDPISLVFLPFPT